MKKYFLLLIALCLPFSFLLAQLSDPEQDIDYASGFDFVEQTDGSKVIHYTLENLADRRIMFYHLTLRDDGAEYQTVSGLPEDVLILEPGQKKVYFKCKSITQCPGANWHSEFMEDVTGSIDYPEQDRDYVFYTTYTEGEGTFSYQYFLKNISGKEIRFHDFTTSDDPDGITILSDIPYNKVVLQPDESRSIYSFTIYSGSDTPFVEWYAKFHEGSKEYEVSEYPFCEGIKKVVESATDGEFGPVRGSLISDDLDIIDRYESTIHIDGLRNEEVWDYYLAYAFWSYVGESGPFGDINNLFEEYRTKIRDCLGGDIKEEIKWGKEEDSFKIRAEYNGIYNGSLYYIELQIGEDYGTDNFDLELTVEEGY